MFLEVKGSLLDVKGSIDSCVNSNCKRFHGADMLLVEEGINAGEWVLKIRCVEPDKPVVKEI